MQEVHAAMEEHEAVNEKVVMLTGHRKSASRVKEQNFESKDAAKEEHAKAAKALHEEITAALENEEQSGGSDSDSSASSSSSSSSSFGQMNDDSDVKGKRKAKSKAKAAATKKAKVEEKEKGALKSAVAAPKKKASLEKEQARFEVIFTGHEKTGSLLDEVSPASIWRSLVRSIEIERRLSKASTAVTDLQQLQANTKLEDDQIIRARNLEKGIAENVQWITAMKDAAKTVRTLEALQLSNEVSGENLPKLFAKCATQLCGDVTTLSDMVHSMAKKLFEATWLDSEINEFRQSQQEFQEANAVLKNMVERMTQTKNADLQEVLAKCHTLASKGEDLCKRGALYVTCIVFSDWVLIDGSPQNLKKIDNFVKKNFGSHMGLGHLPEKLDLQVKTVSQKTPLSKPSDVEAKVKVKQEKKAKDHKEKKSDSSKVKKAKKEK
eukprot:Skav223036  [mRNA]  locus=scaffold5:144660:156894:- [translate_table: standard]